MRLRPALFLPISLVLAACSVPTTRDPAPSPAANAGTASASAPLPDQREARVRAWVKAAYAGQGAVMLRWGAADLNGDGTEEVLAYVGGPMLCGTGGCDLIILADDGQAFSRIGDLSTSQLPVGVLETKTNGWRDLAVTTYGGGAERRIMKVPFDGKTYASNPTVAPATPVATIGTEVVADGAMETLD